MLNTQEYNALPEELRNWIDRSAAKVNSPSRRDEVRAILSRKLSESYKKCGKNVDKVLEEYGSADLEAEKNEFINQLPDRNQWKVWKYVTIILGVAVVISLATIFMNHPQLSTLFMNPESSNVIMPILGPGAGGSLSGAVVTRALVWIILMVLSYMKMRKDREKTVNLYDKFEKMHAYSEFGGKTSGE